VKLQTARHPKLKEGLNQINMSWKQYIANEFFDNVLNSAEKYIANEFFDNVLKSAEKYIATKHHCGCVRVRERDTKGVHR